MKCYLLALFVGDRDLFLIFNISIVLDISGHLALVLVLILVVI